MIVSSKILTKLFPGFLPQNLKSGQIKKALYYVKQPLNTNQRLFNKINIKKALIFLIQPTFRFQGRNFSNFCVGFLKKLRHQKVILKSSDLYSMPPYKITTHRVNILQTIFRKKKTKYIFVSTDFKIHTTIAKPFLKINSWQSKIRLFS